MKRVLLSLMTVTTLWSACSVRESKIDPGNADVLNISQPMQKDVFYGAYFADVEFKQLVLERNDLGIDFNWGTGVPGEGLPADGFSVRWTGDFTFAQDGNYEFVAGSDQGMRVLVDDAVVLDFPDSPAAGSQSTRVKLKAGQHRIVAEYREDKDEAFARLTWSLSRASEPTLPGAPTEVSAEDFLKGLKFGVNVERSNAFRMGDFASGLESYKYLKSLGFTHVRLTYPFRPTVHMGFSAGLGIAPTRSEFSRILPSIHNANAAGLKVFFDLSDVIEGADLADKYRKMMDDYFKMAAEATAAENFDPNMVAIGIANEWGSGKGETNAVFNPHRQRLLGLLRKHLPRHILTTGPANWKHYGSLMKADFELSQDTRVIYDVHAYEDSASDKKHWASVAAKLAKWSAEHGNAKVIFGEAGFAWNDYKKTELYYNSIEAMYPNALPLYPTLWAITDGGSWRMNKAANDYHLAPELAWIVKYINGIP